MYHKYTSTLDSLQTSFPSNNVPYITSSYPITEAIQYWGEYSDDREYSSSITPDNPDGDGIDDDDYFFGIDEASVAASTSKTESSLSDAIHGLSMSAAALMYEGEAFDYTVFANPFAPYAYAKSSTVSQSGQ